MTAEQEPRQCAASDHRDDAASESVGHHSVSAGTAQLTEALERYLSDLEAGRVPDKGEYQRRYPEIAGHLAECLQGLEFIHYGFPRLKDGSEETQPNQIEPLAKIGDYRIVREIGRGGMGVVYIAEQLSLGRTVALKILPFASMLDQRQLERFKNESRAAAMLKHPNIVSVYSVGYERGIHYYAMELVEGESLAHVIDQLRAGKDERVTTGPQTLADTQPIAALSTQHSSDIQEYYRSITRLGNQVAEAIHYAHEQGVVHRDIKPSNLLLGHDSKLLISDFGLAQVQGDHTLTMTGDLIGTLRYMSPEQAEGTKLLDHRTDIYSLGVTLYEAVTLKTPFDGDNRQRLLRQIGEQQPPAPRKTDRSIPADLETIVLKAMAKRPESRYDSARALADDLRRFLEHKPIKARRVTRWQVVRHLARRNPMTATLVATVALLLLLLGVAGPLVAVKYAHVSKDAQASRAQALRELYVSNVNRAYAAWQEGNIDHARELLNRHIPRRGEADLRGFEWHHLWGRYQRTLSVPMLREPSEKIAFTPDGRVFISAGNGVTLWDAATRKELRRLNHDTTVSDLAISADGTLLASCGGNDNSVKLWDLKTGDLLGTLRHDIEVASVAFSPDGTTLAVGCGWYIKGPIHVWDVQTRTPLKTLSGHIAGVVAVEFSPDGRLLASASLDRTVRLWHATSWQEATTFTSHAWRLVAIAFSADSRKLATASLDGSVKLWDTETYEMLGELNQSLDSVYSVAFSPNQQIVAVGYSDGQLRLWHLASNQVSLEPLHSAGINCMAFSPDGAIIATGGRDKTVRFMDVNRLARNSGERINEEWVTNIAYPNNGDRILAAGSWEVVTSSRSGEISLFHLDTREGHLITRSPTSICSIAISPDGRLLAAGVCVDTKWTEADVQLWDLATGKLIDTLLSETTPILALAFSPGGDLLATASFGSSKKNPPTSSDWDSIVRIWDVGAGKQIAMYRNNLCLTETLVFAPNSEVLAIGGGGNWRLAGEIKLWRFMTDVEPVRLTGLKGLVRTTVFSPDGRTFVAGDSSGCVTQWDVASVQEKRTIKAHTDHVTSLSFSPNGRTLASGGLDRTVRLWHVTTGDKLATLKTRASVSSVAFLPDGRTLAAGCMDRTVKLWERDGNVELLSRAEDH